MNIYDESYCKYLESQGFNLDYSKIVVIPDHKNIDELVNGIGYRKNNKFDKMEKEVRETKRKFWEERNGKDNKNT